MLLKSQTWNELKLLLRELPPKRLRFLALVLLASLLQGLIDIFLVGLLARLVGLLTLRFPHCLRQCRDQEQV